MKRTGLNWGGALVLLVVCGVIVPQAHADSASDGAAFLNIPVGAGPAAVGSAYSALATDAYAPTWNPGGLGRVEGTQVSGQHLAYLESINYEYASLVHRFRGTPHALGFAVQYLHTGDIAGTDNAGNSIGDFSSHFAAYSLAYGRALGEKLSLGATGKFIHEKISDVSASAYAADLGLHYNVSEKLALAGVIANMGSKVKFLNESDPLPLALRVGAAWQPLARWTVSSEGVFRKSGAADGRIGLAWRPLEMLSIRAGYRTDTLEELSAVAGVTAGFGLHLWGHELAYAFVPLGDLGNTQYVSLLLRFGQEVDRRRNLIRFESIKPHQTAQGADSVIEERRQWAEEDFQQLMQLLDEPGKPRLSQSAAPPSRKTSEGR